MPTATATAPPASTPAPPSETQREEPQLVPLLALRLSALAGSFAGDLQGVDLTLPNGQPASIAISPSLAGELRAATGAASIRLVVEAVPLDPPLSPPVPRGAAEIAPYGDPIRIAVQLLSAEGDVVAVHRAIEAFAGQPSLVVALPVLHQPANPASTFVWLRALHDRQGRLAGYLRPPASFDAERGTVALDLPLDHFAGVVFVPAIITASHVRSIDPDARIYSGPTAEAIDFGLAGPPGTVFTVVGPPVAGRVFVYNPLSDNYGWLDQHSVDGVGPVP